MKNILLVNACLLGDNNGTGNTLASVFKSINKESVYELCIDFLREPINDRHYLFVDKKFSLSRFLLAERRKGKALSEEAAKHRANISGARATGFKSIIHEFLRGLADSLPVRISPSMKKYIESIKPEYIYTCGSSITSLKISRKIATRYKLPLVLHIMDNWEETLYTSSVLTKPFSSTLKRELRKANKCSVNSLAISQVLCDKFKKQYNVNYLPLMNTMDDIKNEPKCFSREKLVFLYAGSLSINRYVSLCDVACSLDKALGKDDYVFKLFVPSTQNTEEMHKFFKDYQVEFSDYIPRDQLYKEYENADVLVIAESFDKNFCDFTKYSLSTKLPEYMSCGKPILAYLCEDLYSYTYLKNSGAAVVADSKEQLVAEIDKIKNYDKRFELAKRGIEFVKEKHSRDYCDKILREIFK